MCQVTELSHFSAIELERFIGYGTWVEESSPTRTPIEYNPLIKFSQTFEDVSAIYGEARDVANPPLALTLCLSEGRTSDVAMGAGPLLPKCRGCHYWTTSF